MLAEGTAVRLSIRLASTLNTIDVAPGCATFVAGAIADLVDVERSATEISIRARDPLQVAEPALVVVPDDPTAIATRFTSDTHVHQATLAALVAARHASWLDHESARLALARLWGAAKGAPLAGELAVRLAAAISHTVEMIDPDRFSAFDEIRALGVVEAALRGSPRDIFVAALGARADVWWRDPALVAKVIERRSWGPVASEARWLSVVAKALALLDVVDPGAVDVLARALSRIAAPSQSHVDARLGARLGMPSPTAARSDAAAAATAEAAVRTGWTTGGPRPWIRPFVVPVVAGEEESVVLHIDAATKRSRVMQLRRKEVAYVTGSLVDLVGIERTASEVTVRLANEGHHEVTTPASPLFEDDLDAFVERISSTPHPLTFAALVGARHVARIETPTARAHDIAARFWAFALQEKDLRGIPPAFANEIDTMFGKLAGGGAPGDLQAKIVLKTAITSSTRKLVLAALGASAGIANLGGGSDEQFAKRIDERRGHPFQKEEKEWLSMVAGALTRLNEHSPGAVRALASALGFSVDRAAVPAQTSPSPAPRDPPSDPPVVHATAFGGSTLRLIEVAGGSHQRFRIELDGRARRVRVPKTVMDVSYPKRESYEWIEADDAELGILAACLSSAETKRTEQNGRLRLELRSGDPEGAHGIVSAQVSVDEDGTVEVDMMKGWWDCNPHVGW